MKYLHMILWSGFCFLVLLGKESVPLYSRFAESVLDSAFGFFVYGLGWGYKLVWEKAENKGFLLQLFKHVWWPISPMFPVFGSDLDEVSRYYIVSFCFISISASFFRLDKKFAIFVDLIEEDARDRRYFEKIKTRSDIAAVDFIYWLTIFYGYYCV